jgi:hypothetical protein
VVGGFSVVNLERAARNAFQPRVSQNYVIVVPSIEELVNATKESRGIKLTVAIGQ